MSNFSIYVEINLASLASKILRESLNIFLPLVISIQKVGGVVSKQELRLGKGPVYGRPQF